MSKYKIIEEERHTDDRNMMDGYSRIQRTLQKQGGLNNAWQQKKDSTFAEYTCDAFDEFLCYDSPSQIVEERDRLEKLKKQ